MATWVKSSQDIENHPKTIRLMRLTGLDRHAVIGRLHCFWWWVQKYAESGDLTPFSASEIDTGLGFPEGQNFIEKATAAGWIDTAPYFRVHDWWDHNGPWLLAKYKKSPEKWEDIKKAYKSNRKGNSYRNSTGNSTEKLEDVEKITEKAVRLGASAHVKREAEKPTAQEKEAPQPIGSRNGSVTVTDEQPTEDLLQVVEFMQTHLPPGAEPPDPTSSWNGHTLATETDRYLENGMKAAWEIFVDPDFESSAYAAGQHYSTREFLRQLNAITDHPNYVPANRRHREARMKRFADQREPAPAEV